MSGTEPASAGGWDRRRLLIVLAGVVLAAAALLAGLAFAVAFAVGSSAPPMPGVAVDADAAGGDAAAVGQAKTDRIAAAPMLQVAPTDALPAEPAAVAAPTIVVPASTGTGPAGVPSGFPRTPEGAVGQVAGIAATVLQGMSIPQANEVYTSWALPGGTGIAGWELTRNVQAFLGGAGMGPNKDVTATVVATPAAGQVKGTDGPGWVLACVLLEVRATITTDAAIGYGHCERMAWHAGRWMIAPGAAPARAPSTWPGTEASAAAGWRTWVEAVEAGLG